MKLDHDCVRDVLICLEEKSSFNDTPLTVSGISSHFQNTYTRESIFYSLKLLYDGGLISSFKRFGLDDAFVNGLTWTGHEYLDNIRDKSVWDKLKDNGLSSISLEVAKDLAKEIVIALVKGKFHLD